ncbi:putative retrotransposon ty1-copia subclass protein [Tanacetum coccineum]
MKRLVYPYASSSWSELALLHSLRTRPLCFRTITSMACEKSIPETAAMLKLARKLEAMGERKNKGKSKLAYDPMHTIPPPTKKEHPAKDEESHHCALDLYVGNDNRAAVEAIGSFDLILLSGMVLVLDNAEHDDVEPQTDINLVHRSVSIPQAHERYGYYVDAEEHKLEDHGEPTNYRVAFSDPKFDKWLEAMNVEMQSMKDNQVWNLVDLPPNYKIVGSKWLFKKKTDMDGNKHTYKACLIAKGFTQTYRVNN